MECAPLTHLRRAYPKLSWLFDATTPLASLTPTTWPIAECISRIVTGQMLSRHAAQTIYERAQKLAEQKQLRGTYLLSRDELRRCGVSRSKAEAITAFGAQYAADPTPFEAWRTLPFEGIREAVGSHRGLGDWSASILALFYFGQEDVFPETDGTLKRALQRLAEHPRGERVDPHRASPHRSVLAQILWRAIDHGII